MRFFDQSRQGPRGNSSGYKGFYYHFLDMRSGERAWQSELSTIDTALLCAGMLTSAQYFTNDDSREKEIRSLSDRAQVCDSDLRSTEKKGDKKG